jgi:signal peptidase II
MGLYDRVNARSRKEFRLITVSVAVAVFLLIVDQLTKLLVEQQMQLGKPLPIIKGFFSLTYVTNKGAAWGMFHGYGMMLFAIGALVIITAIYCLRKLCNGYPERYIAVMVLLSGVVGNSIDRIWRGEVVDFLDCYIGSYHWPVFNIADCAICIGIGIYTISVLLRPESEAAAKEQKKQDIEPAADDAK